MAPKKKIEADPTVEVSIPVKKPRTPKAKKADEEDSTPSEDLGGEGIVSSPILNKKQKAALSAEKNGPHIRDIVTPKPLVANHKFVKVISWNVNGFKALVANNLTVLTNLVANHRPDVLCLQETKLQTTQVDDFRNILEGYESYWNCSIDKKGYSGTAIFINKSTIDTKSLTEIVGEVPAPPKKKQATLSSFFKKSTTEPVAAVESTPMAVVAPVTVGTPLLHLQRISYDFEDEVRTFHGEGRTITLEFDDFIVLACYVPNSGEGLVRLDYRVQKWDPFVRNYINRLSQRKPVVFTGDLNVGFLDLDIHNPTAKHIEKQAGLTPQERQSHAELLKTNFMDAFRYYYPEARGQFTYWSQRTFARPVNRGIRLDYFICSKDMFHLPSGSTEANKTNDREREVVAAAAASEGFVGNVPAKRVDVSLEDIPTPGVYDSYILSEDTRGCSDHGPVVLVVKI